MHFISKTNQFCGDYMETYIKNKRDINLMLRMDFNFWSPGKQPSSDHEMITIKECVGREAITASAFYPSIVPYYTLQEEVVTDEFRPFIRVTDARNGLIDYSKTVFLSTELLDALSSSIKRVKPGDIVITKGGEYIGEAALVPDYYEEYGTCRDIMSINMRRASVTGEYLTSYLQSAYGKGELVRTKSVQGQPHLTISKVAELKVPIYDQDFQDRIAVCWELFYQLIDESNTHLERAKMIFDCELDHRVEKCESAVSFEKSMNVNAYAQRFDVEYYEKKWSNLVRKLREDGHEFRNIVDVKEKIEIDDPEQIFNYITLSDIDDRSGIMKEPNRMEAYKLPGRAKRRIRRGDVLVSSLKGSKEKVAIVNSDKENLVASTGFYVIREEGYLPEVLYLIFRSRYYDLFIEQMASGAIMSSITDKYFKRFCVPQIDAEIQKEIAEEINAYMNTRKMAFDHLDAARTAFDNML